MAGRLTENQWFDAVDFEAGKVTEFFNRHKFVVVLAEVLPDHLQQPAALAVTFSGNPFDIFGIDADPFCWRFHKR